MIGLGNPPLISVAAPAVASSALSAARPHRLCRGCSHVVPRKILASMVEQGFGERPRNEVRRTEQGVVPFFVVAREFVALAKTKKRDVVALQVFPNAPLAMRWAWPAGDT
jgi:hypothetical protein